MKTIPVNTANVATWPKRVKCDQCGVNLEYSPEAIYLANEFELDGPGNLGFWVDCPNCTKSTQLSENHLPRSFREYLIVHPRKAGAKNSVTIVGGDPAKLADSWPKVLRCKKCNTGLVVDVTDVHIGESFSPDGSYEGTEFYIICAECSQYQALDLKVLPNKLTREMSQALAEQQKRTGRDKLLAGDQAAWNAEIRGKWATLDDDQKWALSGEVFSMLDDRIALIQQVKFENLPDQIKTRTVLWLKGHPGAWPLI